MHGKNAWTLTVKSWRKKQTSRQTTEGGTSSPNAQPYKSYIMVIVHEPEKGRFYTIVNGFKAHVAYHIKDGSLDIRHTIVPEEIGGRGIASELVKATYDYAVSEGLKPVATCRFAVIWLERHPEYKGSCSKDRSEGTECAI